MKKIIIVGGDGFCGWPTALHFSNIGWEVCIVDNLSRRKIDVELGVKSLTPIESIETRIEVWKDLTSKDISFEYIDVSKEYEKFRGLIKDYKPDTIVHFGEQRAAPYSMKNSDTKRYTIDNNINGTHNILCAITELKMDVHIIHLGTMGVYGYGTAGMVIPEGYLKVSMKGESIESGSEIEVEKEIIYPPDPGSIYHLTKTQDALTFQYYSKNYGVRVTDLHQGVVWGTNTTETSMDERLTNRFDYDGDYGTVINRFLMQAAINYPLTVYGTGGQTRACIHIQDTVKCIQIASENPPKKGGKVKIFNQMAETISVLDIAKKVSSLTGVEINYVKNPRNEDDKNDLHVSNKCFIDLGFTPTTLRDDLFVEVEKIAKKYSSRCDKSKIICTSLWK